MKKLKNGIKTALEVYIMASVGIGLVAVLAAKAQKAYAWYKEQTKKTANKHL